MAVNEKLRSTKGRRNAPILLKLFVVIHLAAITIWAMPNPPPDVLSHKRTPFGTEHILAWNHDLLKSWQPVPCYLFVTGFWQYWDMFSPDPAKIDIWVDASVTFKNGQTKVCAYPRMYSLPIPMKFMKERYRKFYERVNLEENSYLWPVVAQTIAHWNDNPNNPPIEVKLRRHWLEVFEPGKPQPTEYSQYEYFDYAVDPARLEWARTHY